MKYKISKLEYAWIWFWYNDITRIFFVVIPSYFIIIIPLILWIFPDISEESFKTTLIFTYMVVLLFAFNFNDYTNLNKIGLTTNRTKINTLRKPE